MPSFKSYHKVTFCPLTSFYRHLIVQVHWKQLRVEILTWNYNLEFVHQNLIEIIFLKKLGVESRRQSYKHERFKLSLVVMK